MYNMEWNKTIYRELRKGRKPEQIIEKRGFPSKYVQGEYELFNTNRDTNMMDFQAKFVDAIEAYVKNESPNIQSYIRTHMKKGYLSNDELLELIMRVAEG